MAKYYIDIKNKKIPVIVRNYKNTNNIKIFFSEATLNISKPKYVTHNEMMKFINKNEDKIYDTYMNFLSNKDNGIKKWETGNTFPYLGQDYVIDLERTDGNSLSIEILEEIKSIKIIAPNSIENDFEKQYIDKAIKQLLKKQTEKMLEKKLPYWSKLTQIEYTSFNVRDSIRKYGSCVPKLKKLYFSSRLIMLPEDKIDAIIVHELCHIVYPNHSKDFYNLVKKYINNYDEINKWLKQNNKLLYI